MRKIIVLFFGFCIVKIVYSQDFSEIKTPNATSFERVNMIDSDMYVGKVKVKIPLLKIKLGELIIPIELSYNTGGVKVNSSSSSIGLNWSLNAGGLISINKKGSGDLERKWRSAEPSALITHAMFINLGFLTSNFVDYNPNYIDPTKVDGNPDVFYAYAPNLFSKFIFKKDFQPMEIEPKGNIIEASTEVIPNIPIPEDSRYFDSFKIISNNGFKYYFSAIEEVSSFVNEAFNEPNYDSNAISRNKNVIKLTSIEDPISKNKVYFDYLSNQIVDANLHTEDIYKLDGTLIRTLDYYHDTYDEKLLSKIRFNEGEIRFIYSNDREDIVGGKRLSQIKIYNNNNILIKTFLFLHGYFNGNKTNNNEKRLRLYGIDMTTPNTKKIIKKYRFNYYKGNLPNRFSLKTDYTGCYNNSVGTLPKLYRNSNNLKEEFLPFPIEGYIAINNGRSLEVNPSVINFASLKEIYTPNGGKIVFEYEPNSFIYNETEIKGGGIRIKKQKIFENNLLIRELNYSYKNDNGSCSGNILEIPKFVDLSEKEDGQYSIDINNALVLYSRVINGNNTSQDQLIGYNQVKVEEQNNGYTIFKFTNSKDFPVSYSENTVTLSGTNYLDFNYLLIDRFNWVNNRVIRNLTPRLKENNEIYRGKLINKIVYNNDGKMVKKINIDYQFKEIDSINTFQIFYKPKGIIFSLLPGFMQQLGESGNQVAIRDDVYIPLPDLACKVISKKKSIGLKKKTTIYEEYFNNQILTKKIVENFNPKTSLLKSKVLDDFNNKIVKDTLFYPNNDEVSIYTGMDSLVAQNRISTIIKKIKNVKYNFNEIEINTILNKFSFNADNNPLLRKIIKNKRNDVIDKNLLEILKYDNKGNPTEVIDENGIHATYIWGYNKSKIILKIENIAYDELMNYVDVESIQNLSDLDINYMTNNQLLNRLKELYSYPEFRKSKIYAYTYKNGIGVSSIINNKGNSLYYKYDNFNRLKYILDDNFNIIEQYDYNIKALPELSCENYNIYSTSNLDENYYGYRYIDCSGNLVVHNGIIADLNERSFSVCVQKNSGGVSTSGYIMGNYNGECNNSPVSNENINDNENTSDQNNNNCTSYQLIFYGNDSSAFSYSYTNCSDTVISQNGIVAQATNTYICVKENTSVTTSGGVIAINTSTTCN